MNPDTLSPASMALGLGSNPRQVLDDEEEKRRKGVVETPQNGFGSIYSGGAIGDLFGGQPKRPVKIGGM